MARTTACPADPLFCFPLCCLALPGAPPAPRATAQQAAGENFVVSKGSVEQLSGVTEVRQMSKVVEELKHMLGAATIDDIVPRFNMILHHKASQAAQ